MSTTSTSTSRDKREQIDNVFLWEDPDGVMSEQVRHVTETVCFAGATTIICLVGIPVNILSCFVFWRQGLRDRMNLCLFCLALVDFSYLMSDFVLFPVTSYIDFYNKELSEEYHMRSVVVWLGVLYGLRSTSQYIGLVIAVERCICVIFPLRASFLMKTRTMGAIIFLIFLLFQLCFLVAPISLQTVAVETKQSRHWVLVYTEEYYKHRDFFNEFGNTFLGIAVHVTNFVVVFVATVVTIIRLKSAMAWRKKSSSVRSSSSSSHYGQQVALTSVLVLVSCVHIVTMVPFVMYAMSLIFISELSLTGRYYNLFMAINAIVHVFPRINCAVNFFIYFFRSSRFRNTMRAAFYCNGRRPVIETFAHTVQQNT